MPCRRSAGFQPAPPEQTGSLRYHEPPRKTGPPSNHPYKVAGASCSRLPRESREPDAPATLDGALGLIPTGPMTANEPRPPLRLPQPPCTNPRLARRPICRPALSGQSRRTQQPPTYESALILGGHRVCGVGHNFVGRQNLRAKQRIPAGSHQNRCDPNLPTTHVEYNRHEPLPTFTPTDFDDFIRKCATLWAIDLQAPEVLV